MNGFSDMLKYFRKRAGLTQQELADAVCVTRSRIANYEQSTREPDFETLELLADFFNVDINNLMGRPLDEPTPATHVLLQALRGATEEEIMQAVKIIEALRK